MPFGMWARVDPASLVLDRGLDPPRGMGNFGVGKHGHAHGQFTKAHGSCDRNGHFWEGDWYRKFVHGNQHEED